jgi:hypothetical protein
VYMHRGLRHGKQESRSLNELRTWVNLSYRAPSHTREGSLTALVPSYPTGYALSPDLDRQTGVSIGKKNRVRVS